MAHAITRTGVATLGAAIAAGTAILTTSACSRSASDADRPPHVEHITLPTHKIWRVVSVQPYEGLEEVELVKVDWPTAQQPTFAFALTREGLATGDGVCLDHILEIDTFWAHPRPDEGCEALDTASR